MMTVKEAKAIAETPESFTDKQRWFAFMKLIGLSLRAFPGTQRQIALHAAAYRAKGNMPA